MKRRPALAPLLLPAALACAQPQAPPGGQPDRAPPRVIEVSPAAFDTAVVAGEPVVIRFDERLSERLEGVSRLEDAVVVSPATGAVRVDRGRRQLEIGIAGGWRPGLVYRVVVLPVFRDLFGNRRTEPIELVFSTGAPIPETALAGFVEDRLTGLPVEAARVQAVRRIDTVSYVAVTDTAGFFAMRYLPAGAFDVVAWLDQDRDREPDFAEPRWEAPAVLSFDDTLVVEARLLPGDTTPARLALAEPLDSITVRLVFDDYFAVGPVAGQATVRTLPDSALLAEGELLHGAMLDSLTAARRAVADSLEAAADTAGVDVPPDTTDPDIPPAEPAQRGAAAAAAAARGAQAPAGAAAEPLPSRELILLLPEALEPGAAYEVAVEGVTNIRGLPGGGGVARFQASAAVVAPPDTAAAGAEPVGTGPAAGRRGVPPPA